MTETAAMNAEEDELSDRTRFIAEIRKMNAETRKYIEEADKLRSEARKYMEETDKLRAESQKFDAERRKYDRDRSLALIAVGSGFTLAIGGIVTLILKALHIIP